MGVGETLDDIERAASVGLAASFNLAVCAAEDDATGVLSNPSLAPFDYIPVRRNRATVGVLSRARASEARAGVAVQNVMQPLDDSFLVAKNDPLLATLEHMADSPDFRLVLELNEVRGILTLSDLDKLPVRALIFSRVTQVELLLAEYIRSQSKGADWKWLSCLHEKRRERIVKKFGLLKDKNEQLDLLEAADLRDKCRAALQLGLRAGRSVEELETMLDDLRHLRNRVAHAGTLFVRQETAREIARLLGSVRRMISSIMQEMA